MTEPDPALLPDILKWLREGCTYDEARRRAEYVRAQKDRKRK